MSASTTVEESIREVKANVPSISLEDIQKIQQNAGRCSHPDNGLNSRNALGDTPLHCVFKRKEYGKIFDFTPEDPDIYSVLAMISVGACPLKRDSKGHTILDMCDREKFPDLHMILASLTLNVALMEDDEEALASIMALSDKDEIMTKSPAQIIADVSKRDSTIWELDERILAHFDLKKS